MFGSIAIVAVAYQVAAVETEMVAGLAEAMGSDIKRMARCKMGNDVWLNHMS